MPERGGAVDCFAPFAMTGRANGEGPRPPSRRDSLTERVMVVASRMRWRSFEQLRTPGLNGLPIRKGHDECPCTNCAVASGKLRPIGRRRCRPTTDRCPEVGRSAGRTDCGLTGPSRTARTRASARHQSLSAVLGEGPASRLPRILWDDRAQYRTLETTLPLRPGAPVPGRHRRPDARHEGRTAAPALTGRASGEP